MSRTIDAMQYILDLLTDGIVISSKRQIGNTPHDKLTDADLPFVQVYSPTVATPEAALVQSAGDLTFAVDVVAADATTTDSLVLVAEALSSTLRVDSTLRGIAQHCWVSDYGVVEKSDKERKFLSMVISVEFTEGTQDDFVELLDFTDVTLFSPDGVSAIEQSSLYPRGVGFKKGTPGVTTLFFTDDSINPGAFPIDLSGVSTIRYYMYLDREIVDIVLGPTLRIGNSATDYREYAPLQSRHGWQEVALDLANPSTTVGTPSSLANVTAIRFTFLDFSQTATTKFGGIFARFGYSRRDQGANAGRGVHPGF